MLPHPTTAARCDLLHLIIGVRSTRISGSCITRTQTSMNRARRSRSSSARRTSCKGSKQTTQNKQPNPTLTNQNTKATVPDTNEETDEHCRPAERIRSASYCMLHAAFVIACCSGSDTSGSDSWPFRLRAQRSISVSHVRHIGPRTATSCARTASATYAVGLPCPCADCILPDYAHLHQNCLISARHFRGSSSHCLM